MQHLIVAWCAERMRPELGTFLDLSTLAESEELCRERLAIGDKLASPLWVATHQALRIRRVKIETKDGQG